MSTDRRALLVDAFADEPLAGNPAGVVPDAEGLTDDQMQAVAGELGASETAFLRPSDTADRAVRYFTPTQEVELCGHATVASHAHLHADGVVDPGDHTLETAVGDLTIEVEPDGTVWMTQDEPSIRQVDLEYDRAAAALGIDPAALRDVGADLSAAVASTGLAWLLIPVNFLEHLSSIDPDRTAIEQLAATHDAVGVYAFTFDALAAESTLHARAFAPGAGVPEDPVTGTASGACGSYLRRHGVVDQGELRFEQGHFVDRPGLVRVKADGVAAPRVGGRAVTALDGRIAVPPDDADEIIEA
jgi:PhzF family phenazine biosynthesis protein